MRAREDMTARLSLARTWAVAALAVVFLVLAASGAFAWRDASVTVSRPALLQVNAVTSYSAEADAQNDTITQIVFSFPSNTDVSQVTLASVLISLGGTPVTPTSVTPDVAARTVTIALTADANGRKLFASVLANVRNPSEPGSYTYGVSFTSDVGTITGTSAPYTLIANAAAPSVGAVTLGSYTQGVNTTYTVPLTVGARGRLEASATPGGVTTPNKIYVTFPAGYALPAGPLASSVTVNGVSPATAPTVAGQTVTIPIPAGVSVPNGGVATVVFGPSFGLVNPAAGSYTLSAGTSAESGTGTSPAFTITAPVTITVASANRPIGVIVARSSSRAVDGFTLARTAGTDPAVVSAVSIADADTTPASTIASVSVYRDNGDNAYGAGDTLLNATPATFTGSTANVAFDSAEAVTDTPVQYWVVYTFSASAADGATASSRVSGATHTAATLNNTAVVGSTFTVDAAGPSAVITAPAPGAWLSGAPYTITGPASDGPGSGVALVEVMIERSDGSYWDGIGWDINPTWVSATGTTAWSYVWPLPVENGLYAYTITARATDALANAGTSSAVTGVRVDNVAPSGTISIDAGSVATSSTAVALTLSASDGTGSGVAEMRFSDDGTTWSTWESYAAARVWTLPPGDGTKTVYAQFRDVVGNESASVSDDIMLDTAAPTGTVTINGGDVYTSSTAVSLSLSASDGTGSGVAEMHFSDDGTTWSAWEPYAATKAWTLPSGDDAKTVYAEYRDAAGNVSAPASDDITLDAAAPSVSVSAPASGAVLSGASYIITGTASDGPGSGVASVEAAIQRSSDGWYWNGMAWQAGVAYNGASGTASWTFDWSPLPVDDRVDTYTVRARATDVAGTTSSPVSVLGIKVDTVGPSVLSAVAADSTHVDVLFSEQLAPSSVVATAFAIDNGLSVTVASLQPDGVTVRLTTSAQSSGATYTIAVSASAVTDEVGNPNSPGSVSFAGWGGSGSPPPPVLSVASNLGFVNDPEPGWAVALSWTASGSDILYELHDATTGELLLSTGLLQTERYGLAEGTHSFYVVAVDAEGNRSDRSDTAGVTFVGVPPESRHAVPGGGHRLLVASYYDIAVTGHSSGHFIVTVPYDPADVTSAPQNLRLLHWKGNTWADITTSVDTANHTVSGQTDSFSDFAVVERLSGGVVAPHVATGADTDVCAICHRSHTSASTVTWSTQGETPTAQNALLVGTGEYDLDLCYSCHGVEQLGSGSDVQTAFESGSGHTLAPSASAYGPSPKQCSGCHDSHGSARTASGTPFAALLRAYAATDAPVYHGDEYCAACHQVRAGSGWDGLGIWRQTAHATGIAAPASGTGIVCSACHDPHGSSVAPTLLTYLVPPSAPATVAVSANTREMCLGCHSAPSATWVGPGPYAGASHGSSAATIPIPGEWPDAGASRRVGECQTCHNPMGEDDGTGNAVPKLVRATGQALCLQCHDADGPAQADIAQLQYPASATSALEVVGAFGASTGLSAYGQLLTYTQESTGTAPRPLVGPRAYRGVGEIGATAWGDVDGDGINDLVVADAAAPRLDVLTYDPLGGLSDRVGPGVLSIAGTAEYVAVGDVIVDGTGLPEVVTVDLPAGDLYVYRWGGSGLTLVQGPVAVGNVSGMALGDVRGGVAADVVLTTNAPDALYVLSDSGGTLAINGPYTTLAGPRAPSVGDVDASSGTEIVVLNAGEAVNTVSVFRGSDGSLVHSVSGDAPAGLLPTASAVADILPGVTPAGTSGLEVLVTYADPVGASRLNVFPQDGATGLAAPLGYSIGTRANPSAIACGDVDGDGRSEAVIANAGSFTRDTSRQAPSLQVWPTNVAGTALDPPAVHWAGGVELAGGSAGVIVADLGGVGPTRHAVGGAPRTHVSTETAVVPRHVECADCHNSHAANSSTTSAPYANGRIAGTWGVAVSNVSASQIDLTEQRGVRYEYELCLKCHSVWSALDGGTDIASEVNTENASVHAIEATSATAQATAGSFEPGWSVSSVMYCTACHGNSGVGVPAGPHVSGQAPILRRAYWGVEPGDTSSLCYECHRWDVYFAGTADGQSGSTSLFYDADNTPAEKQALHSYHSDILGFGCRSCHDSHGSPSEQHILRTDIGYVHATDGGSCTPACHTATQQRSYIRP